AVAAPAWRGALNLVTGTAVPAPAPVQRKAIALIFVSVLSVPLMILARLGLRLLSAGDEGRQPIDVAHTLGRRRSPLLLLTRRISLLLAHRIGLLLARRIGLLLADRIGLRLARQIGLRLAGAERHLA